MGSISRCEVVDPENIDVFNYSNYFCDFLIKNLKQLFQPFPTYLSVICNLILYFFIFIFAR